MVKVVVTYLRAGSRTWERTVFDSYEDAYDWAKCLYEEELLEDYGIMEFGTE